jgi:hypothetical protein
VWRIPEQPSRGGRPTASFSRSGAQQVRRLSSQLRPLKAADLARVRRIERVAWILDQNFRLPGTRFRFGLDGIIGLIPGVGDVAMSLVSLYILYESRRLGASKRTLARMTGNVLLDLTLGSLPVVGDAIDFFYKSNSRNVRLLQRALEELDATDNADTIAPGEEQRAAIQTRHQRRRG